VALGSAAVGGLIGAGIGTRYSGRIRGLARRALGGQGDPRRYLDPEKEAFLEKAHEVLERHSQQTAVQAEALRARFERPVLGKLAPWDAIERLAIIIDPIDQQLWSTSQWVHVVQLLAALEVLGNDDPDFALIAMLHDMGKLVMLTGEAPENIYGRAFVLGEHEPGIGLLNVPLMFSHPEFMYMRVRDHVPDHVSWTIRHHNVQLDECEPYMDSRDREWLEQYLLPFRELDQGFKSPYRAPDIDLERYRALLESTFPDSIVL
jgi:hypothetical protein